MIRFHLDENFDHAMAHGLRLRGLDVTQDQDFLRRHAAGDQHAGIVYAQQGMQSIGEIVRYLHFLSDCLDMQDMRGQLEFF